MPFLPIPSWRAAWGVSAVMSARWKLTLLPGSRALKGVCVLGFGLAAEAVGLAAGWVGFSVHCPPISEAPEEARPPG